MLYKNKNFSYNRINEIEVSNGDVFINCNLIQINPYTPIFLGRNNLSFVGCNMINCSLPVDSIIENCNIAQIDRCTNKRDDLLIYKEACEERCIHVVDTDEIWIDGVLLDLIYYYKDTVL